MPAWTAGPARGFAAAAPAQQGGPGRAPPLGAGRAAAQSRPAGADAGADPQDVLVVGGDALGEPGDAAAQQRVAEVEEFVEGDPLAAERGALGLGADVERCRRAALAEQRAEERRLARARHR